MVYEIILGREEKDRLQFGTDGTVLLGKHYVNMGSVTALSQPVYLDLNKSHVVFVCGKRGSGKSYSLGVIAEGITQLPEEYRNKLSVIMFDTMGIYWTMKYPNHKEETLLKEWGLEGKGVPINIYVPFGYFDKWKEDGIPVDKAFAINPSELAPDDWNLVFEISTNDPIAVFIERVILELRKTRTEYSIAAILATIDRDADEDPFVRQAAKNRFSVAQTWGLFSSEATLVKDLAQPGQVAVIDLSAYSLLPNGWRIKHLVMGIVCMKLFIERMKARKQEEHESVQESLHYLSEEHEESHMPLCWLMIDEAHEFIPNIGKTASSDALITLLREGRQPGIALVLATQQPGKIHTDAMTQSDIILAHRLTAKIDTDALGSLLQSYLRTGLDKEIDNLPRVPGACIAVDDVNERLAAMRVRPRLSWHGGGAPGVLPEKKKEVLEF
ncbi:ATP-binding protein [Candidatus Woesearchaeota archaeon]|nr:ATP-binding protein [Candidatus Woesearchaeota archaeon]